MLCEYGCNQESNHQLKNKKWCCSNHTSKCPAIKEKNSLGVNKTFKEGKGLPRGMTGKTPWNKGLTKETDNRIKQYSEKAKITFKEKGHNWIGKKHSVEAREKMSKTRTKMYIDGWEASSCGRAKKYTYTSSIAGKISVDGKWELGVVKHLDSLNIKWKRNTERFPYINPKGKKSTYCPDFYVYDWDCYIEVKGYETDLDKCKWSQFSEKLEKWTSNVLIEKGIINKLGEVE